MRPQTTLVALRALSAFVLTSLLVVWLCDLTLSGAQLGGLGIGVLLRGVDPFRGQTLLEATAVSVARSGALLATALAVATAVGIAAGAAYAFSSRRIVRAAAWSVGTVGVSLPSFFWAMLLQLLIVFVYARTETRILPTAGFGLDDHLVLPAVALAARPAAYVFRTTATALENVRHGDYVRTAHAKGLPASHVARSHVLPNAAPAILSGVVLGGRIALSSLAIIEYVFSWNGAGFAFIHALANGRTAFAALVALVFALLFAVLTFGTDALSNRLEARR